MSSTHHRPPRPYPMDLELTIISAKHLKNVNWRNGHLTPYVIFWLDPNHVHATKSDDSNNPKPVWNERFILPVPPGPNPTLTLEVFHYKPSDTNKSFVGSLIVKLYDVINGDGDDIRSFDLKRHSGRVRGKIRLKMCTRQRVDVNNYQNDPQHGFYYPNAPQPNYGGLYPPYNPSPSVPPSPVSTPSQNSCNYRFGSDLYNGYYHGGYYAPPQLQTPWPNAAVDYAKLPPQPPLPQMPRTVDGYGGAVGGGGAGPSAPVDYAQYDQKQKSGKGLSIDEASRYEEEKVVESELNAREMDDYADYRRRVDY